MSYQTWIDAANVEIDDLLQSEPTRENAIFLNALFGIVNYEKTQDKNKNEDICPDSLIDENIDKQLDAFVDYADARREFVLSKSDLTKQIMLEKFDNLLMVDKQILDELYSNTSTPEERQKLINFVNKLQYSQ